jgi:hypothetical protein
MVRRVVRIEPCGVAALARQSNDAGEAGARERVDCIVNGSKAHRRKIGTKPLEKVLRGGVRRVAREQADDRDSLRSEFHTRAPEVSQHGCRPLRVAGCPLRVIAHRRIAKLVRTILNCNWF